MKDKLIAGLLSLGCKSRKDATIAVQLYVELNEVKRYWNVEYFYDGKLEQIYLTAKKTKSDLKSIFIPWHVSENFTFNIIQQLTSLKLSEEYDRVYLAIISSDSTCVYYQISDGLIEPNDTSAKHLKQNKQESRDKLLRKNRKLLEQSALYNIPITLHNDAQINNGSKNKDIE